MTKIDYRDNFLGDRANVYETREYGKDSYYTFMWKLEKKYLKEFLMKRKFKNYLDFACGNGRVIEFLEHYVENSLGIDVSEDMLKIAEKKVVRSDLLLQDITERKLKKIFDLITAFRFFLNAQEDLRHDVLVQFKNLTKKDSVVIISNQGNRFSFRFFTVFINKYIFKKDHNQLSKKDLEKLFENYGFKLIEYRGIGFLPKPFYKIPLINKVFFWLDYLFYEIKIFSYFSHNQILIFERK